MNLHIKLLFRNLFRTRSFSALNILGLTISFTCVFAILVKVNYEFSFDKFLPDSDRLYRLTFETTNSGNSIHFARCWEPWVSKIPASFPQAEELVRLAPLRHTALKSDESKIYTDRIFATDSNFFKIFSVGLIYGTPESVLNKQYSAVLSLSLARKLFGKTNPVGKTIALSGELDEKMMPYTITGVMNDSPENSHIRFDIVTSFVNPNESPDWAYVYILLKKGASTKEILSGMPAFIKENEKSFGQIEFNTNLQNIKDIYLYSEKDREVEPTGSISGIYLLITVAVVLLIISLVNYFNLNKTRLLTLKKQLNILRIHGSGDFNIIIQVITESVISTIISLIISVIILDSINNGIIPVPGFFRSSNLLASLTGIWSIIGVVLITAIITGSSPFIIYILKNRTSAMTSEKKFFQGKPGNISYAILISFQLTLSIILICLSIVIYKQKELVQEKSLGKMRSDILIFRNQNWEIRSKYNSFKSKVLQSSFIKDVSASMEEPSGETLDAMNVESIAIDQAHKDNSLFVLSVEDNFLDFFSLELIAGNNFSKFNPNRKGEDYILNESAIKKLGMNAEEAIGKPFKIKFQIPDIFYGGTIVGVVKDFNFGTLNHEIKPYVLFQKPIFYLCFLVEIDDSKKQEAISAIRKIWEEELPDYPFQFDYLNDLQSSANKKILAETDLSAYSSILSVFIICLGLFSVTSVIVSKRTKEIGIRKVNGASRGRILLMLNSDFIVWLSISFIIAIPFAIYIIRKWLENFFYKTDVELWIYAAAGLLVLSITLLTVIFQSWKAASENPVNALRYE